MENNKNELDKLQYITITKEDGTKEKCMVAFTYDMEETGKKYVAYSNGKFTDDGSLQMYMSELDGTLDNPVVKPIETDDEKYMMCEALSSFQSKVNEMIKNDNNH